MLTPDLSKWVKKVSWTKLLPLWGRVKGKGFFELWEKGKSKKRKMDRGTDYY